MDNNKMKVFAKALINPIVGKGNVSKDLSPHINGGSKVKAI